MIGYKKHEVNKHGRDFCCGDIHGCFDDLSELLDKVNFDESVDRLFTTGDLCDRGPQSEQVLDWLKEPWFHPCYGNHEDMLIEVWHNDDADRRRYNWHLRNGGDWVFSLEPSKRKEIISRILELPLIQQVGNIGFLHALPPDNVPWDVLTTDAVKYKEILIWETGISNTVEGIDQIFVGHQIGDTIRTWNNVTCLDTGSFLKYWDGYDGHISLVEIAPDGVLDEDLMDDRG